jgi:hypothetical protein
MFVDSSTTRLNGKAYPRHLLRESYREVGKVKHRTIANLSHCNGCSPFRNASFRRFLLWIKELWVFCV